jgi:glycosyltransferase involved in cell wall biosynthesis
MMVYMDIALAGLGVSAFVELLLWWPLIWRVRRLAAAVALVLLTISTVAVVWLHPMGATLLLLLVSLYRAVNLQRIIQGRMDADYLRRTTPKTSLWLLALQAVILIGWSVCVGHSLRAEQFWSAFNLAQLAGIIVILLSTERHLRKTVPPAEITPLTDKELPTLTVAIPARNETDDLQACLESLIASDYPKLEIIVLDDCSQNSRTPQIIRSFAQGGVRFLQGVDIKDNWLAKNQAYQQLLEAANGEYILFAGVDSRYEPHSLRRLVEALLHKNKTMMSIIPKNLPLASLSQNESMLLQPMRYAWELSLPRKLFNRPAVLSTCWLIQRKLLLSAGGFAGVSRSIVPESYFARVSSVHDGYSFMQSNETIGVTSMKAAPEQWNTAIRTRYPQLHRRPELVLLMTMSEILGLLAPFGFLAVYSVRGNVLMTLLALVNCLLIFYIYGRVVCLTYRRFLWPAFVAAPLAAMLDIAVLNLSMLKYEFSRVIWKGRNVCIPVMYVIPKLQEGLRPSGHSSE